MLEKIWNKGKIWTGVIISGIIFVIAYNYAQWFIAFPSAVMSAIMLVKIVHWIDDKGMGKVSTYNEIVNNGNVAYAIYFLGICLVVAVGYLAPFLVFVILR